MQSEQFSQRFKIFCDHSIFSNRGLPGSSPWIAVNGSIIAIPKKQNPFESIGIIYEEIDLKKSAEIFIDYLPQLSIVELAFIQKSLQNQPILDFQHLVKLAGYLPNEVFMLTLSKILQLPIEFNLWSLQKKVGIQDLAPLRGLTDLMPMDAFFKQIARLNLGRHEGLKVLELGIDLFLLSNSVDKILFYEKFDTLASGSQQISGSLWISHLEALRYPRSLKIGAEKKNYFETINWPAKSKAKFVQRGDLFGVELSLFFSAPSELERIANHLLQISKQDLTSNENS
jgi:hypothetical protein